MKGYAFIEFDSEEVANVVVKTLNGYMIFGKVLKARMIKQAELKFNIFKAWNRKTKFANGPQKFITKNNLKKTPKEKAEKVAKLLESEKKKREVIKEMGIDFKFAGYVNI